MQNRIVIFDLDGTIYQNSVFHRGYLRTLVAGTWAEPLEADLVRLAEAIFAGRKLDMNRFYRRGRAEAATVPELVQALRKRVLPNMTYAEALQADDVVYLGDAWAVLAYLGDALGCLDGDRANEVYRLTRLQMEQAGMHGDRGLYEAIMRLEQRCCRSADQFLRRDRAGVPAAAWLCRSVPRDLQQCEQALRHDREPAGS